MPRPTSSLHPPPITTSASSPDLTSHLNSNENRRTRNSFGSGSSGIGGIGAGGNSGGGTGGGNSALTDSDDDDTISSSSSSMSLPLSGGFNGMGGIGGGMLHPSSFAPPFYNRPPTPLPPSPSLTSLLRPPFTPSRPTTPDSSDSEAVATSSRIAQSTPRAAPKVPTYEYYGFVLYLVSSLAFLIYIIWSFAPSPLLHAVGIHYYPSRWWALALPSFLVMLVVYIYVALASYNTGYLTRGLDHLECIVDDAAKIANVDFGAEPETAPEDEITGNSGVSVNVGGISGGEEAISPISPLDGGLVMKSRRAPPPPPPKKEEKKTTRRGRAESVSERWKGTGVLENDGQRDWKALWNRGTDAVMDIPVGGVCEVLYGDGREREQWEIKIDQQDWGSFEVETEVDVF
ncbi:PIG-P-domain-containing protein [Choiromyces venosus 120613-1]|uniref:PIG-P-domain-containing protein n=1 Tax=Choiromyces venosus 120613-1 TaxID=1336337 RepID=A0A3N4K111_9PEZI|nr:PIG-P-domain-containing protein [Choiromyces venosus 120613-1]